MANTEEHPSGLEKVSEHEIKVLKLETLFADEKTDEPFKLFFPCSRIARDFSQFKTVTTLTGFEGRIQNEYNRNPVGQYMGPYDQSEYLELNAQLPKSDLDFEKYTEFQHSNGSSCKSFSIKKNHDKFDDLEKFDALEINDTVDDSFDDEEEDESLVYTCTNKECRIPCPCSPCCSGNAQCREHKLEHPDLFDEKLHAISVRSTDVFCEDESFFSRSYILKFSGIPIECPKCEKDLLHHHCYHLDYHKNCKFCRHNIYKQFQDSAKDLRASEKRHEDYLKTVCPYCDSKFCEPYFRKKHVEFQHQEAPFKCDHCTTTFHAKKSKEYHENVHHSNVDQSEICNICEKKFSAKVSLRNHQKYVHSDVRLHDCSECDAKFKQKKDMRAHFLNIHNQNLQKEMYGNSEEQIRHNCEECDSSYKYKKDLNAHMRQKHRDDGDQQKVYECDECSSKFKANKNLVAHKKIKHESQTSEFPCPICEKVFQQKNNMKRHQKIHENA